MNELLARHAADHGVVGAVLGVARDGDVSIARYGTADLTRPVERDTPFQIASITKPMVATVLAMLAERGMLGFDDPITEHIPELHDTGWAARISIRGLMAGLSGIPLSEHREFVFDGEDAPDALARLATDIARAQPMAEPGALWSYSNAAWCLLGRVIETVTGLDWEAAMRTELVSPAGMTRTTFRDFEPATHASHYAVLDGGPIEVPSWESRALGPAGGAIWSTAEDVLRFLAMHMDDRFEMLREIHADVGIPHFADRWCLGWARFDWEGGPVWGWDGVSTGHRAIARVVPDRRLAYVLLTNSTSGRLLYRSLFTELLARDGIVVPEIPMTPAPEPDPAPYEGTYGWPDRTLRVARDGARLLLEDGVQARALTPVGGRRFLVEGAPAEAPTITFAADARALYRLVWALPRQS